MKVCIICKEEKNLKDFYKAKRNKDGHQNRCKLCDNKYTKTYTEENKSRVRQVSNENYKKRLLRNREFVLSYLKLHPCVDCGISDVRVLEFDHLKDKVQNVGTLINRGVALETLEKEINKCVVRCANCHRIKTCEDFKHYRSLGR